MSQPLLVISRAAQRAARLAAQGPQAAQRAMAAPGTAAQSPGPA